MQAESLFSDSPQLDVELLLCHVLVCDRAYLRTWPERALSLDQLAAFETLYARRKAGEPIAHLVGNRSFWTLDLDVSPATLIPRPDTEILVEQALALALPEAAAVLDLGTGTGAIALSLASERNKWVITALDVVPAAVSLAQSNAKKNHIDNVIFMVSSWFEKLPSSRFDLIVSNPPYIDQEDPHLRLGDVRYEPLSALVAKDNGLADIRLIIRSARSFLRDSGWIIIEHGYQQAASVRTLFQDAAYKNIKTVTDYGQQDRVTMAQFFDI
jgi:release factor glutamine methyltransferase